MLPRVDNLLRVESDPDQEQFNELLCAPGLRLERIVSHGWPTPEGQWYDQDDPEWVLLVRGSAELEFDGGRRLVLQAGDHLVLPARVRHRVAQCSRDAIWLALHHRA